MTEDQIKAVAEEFARLKNFNPGFHKEENEMAKLFEQFINFVQMHYCIVERENVMREYQDIKSFHKNFKGDDDYFDGYWVGRLDSYEALFGTSMFNQDEE